MADQAPAGASYTLSPVTDGMQLKTPDGRVVFEYHKQGRVPASGTSRPWEYRTELAFMF